MRRVERTLPSVTDSANLPRWNAERDQIDLNSHRSTLTEREIVFSGSALVTVGLNGHNPRPMRSQDFGCCLYDGSAADVEFGAVVIKAVRRVQVGRGIVGPRLLPRLNAGDARAGADEGDPACRRDGC